VIVAKRCTECDVMKPLTDYYRKYIRGEWRRRSQCKVCYIAKVQARKANP
jgi:hypothetical protein